MPLSDLPKVRGDYKFDFPLSSRSFLKVGGSCNVLFLPEDLDDLENFLRSKPSDLKITILGNMVGNDEFLNQLASVFARRLKVAMAVQ